MDHQFILRLPTEIKENEFFDEDAISKSTIQALNNSFDKQQLDEQLDRPFTPVEIEQPPVVEKEHCPHCERTFFKGRLALHQRSCTAEKPLKFRKATPASKAITLKQCPHCQKNMNERKLESHIQNCANKAKCLNKFQKYVAASINEEVDAEETQQFISQKELSNSQPSFLPKIQQGTQNVLSRSVPIMKCPSCGRMFEQRAALKHIPVCVKLRMNSGGQQRCLFCTNCGSKFAERHKYCGVCGKKR